MITLWDVFFAFISLGLLTIAGRYLHQTIKWFQAFYVPESIIAGLLALILGSEVLGALSTGISHISGTDELIFQGILSEGIFSEGILTVWKQLPPVFITFIFASLLLGEDIPNIQSIWKKAAPQIVFGQVLAWGQYVVGLGVTLLVLVPVFQANPMAGILIEMSFEGGHAASGAMTQTMATLGFSEGGDLALGLSTVGIISGVVIGVALANWAKRKGIVQCLDDNSSERSAKFKQTVSDTSPETSSKVSSEVRNKRDKTSASVEKRRAELMQNLQLDPLTLNFGLVAIAISFGWLILNSLKLLEALTWGQSGVRCFAYVPLFPMTLVGGLILQLILQWLDLDALVMRPLIERISGFVLDMIIVSAIATISFTSIRQNLPIFIILSITGIVWNLAALLLLAPRIFPQYWFERGIGDFGQSMGITATGLLLLRLVDPQNRSEALEAFAYKQLLFTPIVGGGIFSAAAPVLVTQMGAWRVFLLTFLLLVFWLAAGFSLSQPNSSSQNKSA